jgi:putative nucleotidyltransferase with HDIG domain
LQNTGDYILTAEKGLDHVPNIRWSRDHPVIRIFVGRETPITRHGLDAMLRNITITRDQHTELNLLEAELFIPLNAKGNLVGIFILGLKLSEMNYTEDDQLILTTLANQTAVAVENARLFSAEQSRREELDALYELTRQLVATNDVDHVIQNTTRHVVTSAHVTFSRVLTPDTNGSFYCRAAFPIRTIDYNLGAERFEPDNTLPFYQRALRRNEPTFINRNDPGITDAIQSSLMLDLASTICMCPLRVGDQSLGLLILGERREANREPFDADKMRLVLAIADQAANALQRANMHEQMENTFLETVLALANAMDARDTYTNDHSQRMCVLAEVVCRELNCDSNDIWAVHWASLLHDIGKIGVPDRILRKGGPLTEEEWVIMKKHPEIGARIVAPVKKLENVAPLIQAHHERFDGTGYPFGLKGVEIPLGARILSIVDAYTAMTDDRVYRKPRSLKDAIDELRRESGHQFDPALVEVFVTILEKDSPTQINRIELIQETRQKK